ncbi:MAG: glycoside hydrolase family 5 protein, partial [Acetatifactor sp.]|nr:glycoside hydrolase family 5 protein [Acetatifactor sp.]
TDMLKKRGLKKRLTAAALAALLAVTTLGFTACGQGSEDGQSSETVQQSTVEESGNPAQDSTESGGQETSTANKGGDDGVVRESLTALEVAELMGNGINLGNTMEAYGRGSLGTSADPTRYETCWGQPVTTQEMLDGMKAAGFDTLRLPVAWTNMMDFETGDYTINSAYLDRVEEIVGYARNAGMYVIINDHWDGGWWGMFGSASEETRAQAMELYKSMWTQIGERFKDYSDYVIFESGNEELGFRLNDTDIAKDSGTLSDADCYTVTNQINQAFVDTIRGIGGNNANRFLLIAGFGTDIKNTCNSKYKMPTDTVADKLLVSVHYYDPSGYCINTSIGTWGTKQEYETMNETLAMMEKFTGQGYGVVIGEYGVLIEQTNNELKENTKEYVQNFLNNCDLYGYCPVLWDCNNLYNRNNAAIIDMEMARLYTKHSLEIQSEKSREDIIAQAQKEMDNDYNNASEGAGVDENTAMAWIMYNSSDWNIQYSVGDTYSPDSTTAGIVATDVEVTGEGTYTVALDFTGVSGGFANSVVFSALAIANGETLYPGYYVEIQEILINGEPYELKGQPYTCSDDGKATRVNLYNAWVTQVPAEARVREDNGQELSPCILDADTLGNVETISVTFNYAP